LNYTREAGDFTWDALNIQLTVFRQWGEYCDDCCFDCAADG